MQVDILVLLSQHIGPWSNNWQDHKLSSSLGSLSIRYWSLLCGTLKVPNCWFLFLRVSPRHQRVTRKSGSLFGTPLKCSYKFGKFLFRMNIFILMWGIELDQWPLLLSVTLWGSEPAWNRGINIERSIWSSRTHHFSHECGPRTWRTAVLLPSCMFPIQGIPSIKFKGFLFFIVIRPWGHRTLSELFLWPVWRRSGREWFSKSIKIKRTKSDLHYHCFDSVSRAPTLAIKNEYFRWKWLGLNIKC